MSLQLDDHGAWVLSPYCFCDKRPWLTINDVTYLDPSGDVIKDGDDSGSGIASIPGLSADETALLAALLTALAVFLFLLFLLLCCLLPFGLCCGRKSLCCNGAAKKGEEKKNEALVGKAASDSSGNSVNLTEVDMKIPRAWMVNYAGFSDSHLDKGGKTKAARGWGDEDSVLWWPGDGMDGKRGLSNHGFTSDLKDGGWFSTSDLDSIYGGKDRSIRAGRIRDEGMSGRGFKGSNELIALDEFYRGPQSRTTKNANMFRSSSYGDLQNLMTPSSNSDVIVSHSGTHNIGGGSYGNYSSHSDGGRVVETMTVTKQELMKSVAVPLTSGRPASVGRGDTMNAVTEISYHDSGRGTNTSYSESSAHAPSYPPYAESHVTTTTVASTDNNGDVAAERDVTRERTITGPDCITQVSTAYKRVVEETTTTTSE